MFKQMDIIIGSGIKSVYFQDGFYSSQHIISPNHNHYHTEVHIMSCGEIEFVVNNRIFLLNKSCIFAIPHKTFHSMVRINECTRHTAFLINANIDSVFFKEISEDITEGFLCEIQNVAKTNNYSKIAAYISFLCNDLFPSEKVEAREMADYALAINDFFTTQYARNVKLADLAKKLHLSEKQTSRLVLKYTQNTFKTELTNKRMQIANHLIRSKTMPMSDIARYVGYNSYVGFWKALKKTQKNDMHHKSV